MSRDLALERSKEQQRRIKAENDMTTAKYTPGPWGYEYEPDGDNHWIWSAGGDRVATAFPFSTRTTKANARLIAAAPELLEACKSAEWNSLDLPAHTTALLRAAIAKATGETP